MILRKMMSKILCGNFEKSFLEWEKMALRKVFWHFLHANFVMFILLISNHTVFLVQFGNNLHEWVFQKAEIARAASASAISAFWKTHSCKLIPNWTQSRMITYTNQAIQITKPRNFQKSLREEPLLMTSLTDSGDRKLCDYLWPDVTFRNRQTDRCNRIVFRKKRKLPAPRDSGGVVQR